MFSDIKKENIYRDYYDKVYGYICSNINNAATAEDLTADVFVKIYEKLDSFDEGKASLSTWIFTITRNKLTDYYRTRRVFTEIPETLDDGSSIEDDVCNAEMLEALADALETLEERERDIIILRFYKGMTLAEIAKQMDISYSYIKVLQNKAFGAIRDFFKNE